LSQAATLKQTIRVGEAAQQDVPSTHWPSCMPAATILPVAASAHDWTTTCGRDGRLVAEGLDKLAGMKGKCPGKPSTFETWRRSASARPTCVDAANAYADPSSPELHDTPVASPGSSTNLSIRSGSAAGPRNHVRPARGPWYALKTSSQGRQGGRRRSNPAFPDANVLSLAASMSLCFIAFSF